MQQLLSSALGMRYVIRRTFTILLPRLSQTAQIFGTDEDFKAQVEARCRRSAPSETDGEHYRDVLCSTICGELSNLLELVKDACYWTGFRGYARTYLDTARILRIVLERDEAKLASLKEIVDSGTVDAGEVFVRIGAVLDGRAYVYENFTETAKTKASEDVQRVGKCAETMAACGVPPSRKRIECQEVKQLECQAKMAEKFDKVGDRIDAAKDEIKDEIRELSRRVQDLSNRRGRGGRRLHLAARREMCMHCWNVAKKDTALRYSLNTRMTHQAAFNRYRHELEKIGVESAAAFRRIIHSAQSLECEARKRALYAMQRIGKGEGGGAGKKDTCTSKCGIIAHMKNTRNAALDASAFSGRSVARVSAAKNAAVRASCIPPCYQQSCVTNVLCKEK